MVEPHPPPLLGQRRRQLRATLARPAQRRGRVAARERIHQRLERGLDAGLILLDAGPSAARASNAVRRRLVGAISRRPLRIVSRATPVADETTASPP